MLRRRILASAMASVMALTSVAAVVSADETATAVKSKTDLEAYVKSFDGFRSKELYDYGSISGENFLSALEYADNVLADDKANADDYTAAYKMIEAVYNKLTIYSAEKLAALIDSCKKIYDSNNIMNEDLGDLIYTAGSYADFVEAYEEAETVVKSADSRIITDAYEKLESAKSGLVPLDSVTKAQFRTALKAYESALQKEYAYETWRRGKTSDTITWWAYNHTIAYGELYKHMESYNAFINQKYDDLDAIKAVNKTTQEDIVDAYKACVNIVAIFNTFEADDTNRATKANVKTLLKEYHGRLVKDYNTTEAEALYEAIVAELGAAKVHNRLANPNNQYDSAIDMKVPGVAAGADAWYDVTGDIYYDNGNVVITKRISSEISIKTDEKIYIGIDKVTGFWDGETVTKNKDLIPDTCTAKLISAKSEVDLTQFVMVPVDNVTSSESDTAAVENYQWNGVIDGMWSEVVGSWSHFAGAYAAEYVIKNTTGTSFTNSDGKTVRSHVNLEVAYDLAQTYLSDSKDAIKAANMTATATDEACCASTDIDTSDIIVDGTAKGSSAEWTMVYRYLKYALSDKYDAGYCNHTKADVVALIDDAYELAELTGDAAIFNYHHMMLVEARQDALDWVKAANKLKTYKDNVTPVAGAIADTIYHNLKNEYDKLWNDYQAFKYSFGEIYDYIGAVSDMIDEGELAANDTLLAALEDTSYRLSVVKTMIGADLADYSDAYEVDDNTAWTSDRFFLDYNRVFTNGGEYKLVTGVDDAGNEIIMYVPKSFKDGSYGPNASHYDLQVAYEALIAAVKAQTEVTVLKGDVNGDGAVNALDAAAILKAVVDGTTLDAAVADFNADGAVNALDASAILAYVVG